MFFADGNNNILLLFIPQRLIWWEFFKRKKMKKYFLILLLFVSNFLLAQTSEVEWYNMIQKQKNEVELIMNEAKPKIIDLSTFKKKLSSGEIILSDETVQKIRTSSLPLIQYGKELTQKNKLNIIDEDELIFFAAFPPDVDLNEVKTIDQSDVDRIRNSGPSVFLKSITGSEIFNCALVGIGADAAWALLEGSGTSWTIAALRTTFTNVAKRFLGPIGVAWAVGSFAACLYNAY